MTDTMAVDPTAFDVQENRAANGSLVHACEGLSARERVAGVTLPPAFSSLHLGFRRLPTYYNTCSNFRRVRVANCTYVCCA